MSLLETHDSMIFYEGPRVRNVHWMFIGRYMSPELFHAPGKLTEKMDLWALGCLAVEASTGEGGKPLGVENAENAGCGKLN